MAKKATVFQITATVKDICVDADEWLTMVGVGEVLSLNVVEEAILVRKIDWHIMPLVCVVYMLYFLDKTTLSYASNMGFRRTFTSMVTNTSG
ncbi:hypothetical protein CBS147320_68 [Aspergillus niger]|nr:hypothetical protein CBS11350_4194 [Aspergillus niger]KAI2935835.1 hypothetical protein CBS147320_68 [Aspergillus niger]KAI2958554.1 hypothetical protein CBS147322_1458 [Aspergillus niger]KAI3019994.1 hypothetical protein CBS147482_2329 [Aspergillus niger]KAI3057804.1 hypothetical protein CBS147352_1747 [Aspergillus niger]